MTFKFRRTIAQIALVACCSYPSLASQPASAASADDERIRELETRVAAQDALIKALAAKVEALTSTGPVIQPPAPTVASEQPRSGFVAELVAADGITIRPRGRVHVDALLVNAGDGSTPTGTQLRRIQLGAEGRLGGSFRYSAEVAFTGKQVGLEDAVLIYDADKRNQIVVGHFKPSVTADDLMSDNSTIFLERSAFANLFAPGRRIGIGYNHLGENWGLRTSLSGEKDDSALDGNRQEAWAAAARLHGNLLGSGNEVLHLAATSYFTHSSSTDRTFSFTQKPEANRALPVISTGAFAARSGVFLGGEAAWSQGPVLLQAEGGTLGFNGAADSGPRFWGWALQGSWRLTGEKRKYDAATGSFGRIIPSHPLGSGGFGALELGLRMGQVDFSSTGIDGGELMTMSGVINWIPVTHVRLSANVVHARSRKKDTETADQTTLTFRAGLDW